MSQSQNHGIDFSKAPRHEDGYQRYVLRGIPPGDFMYGLLSNNLAETIFRADSTNQNLIKDHVEFIYWELPSRCWGSEEIVDEWINQGGLEGQ